MIDTTSCLEFHAGGKGEAGADTVFTFLTFSEARDFVKGLGGRVGRMEEATGWFRVPATQGGGWIDFPAKRAFVTADGGRKFIVQVHVDQVSPALPMSRKY